MAVTFPTTAAAARVSGTHGHLERGSTGEVSAVIAPQFPPLPEIVHLRRVRRLDVRLDLPDGVAEGDQGEDS